MGSRLSFCSVVAFNDDGTVHIGGTPRHKWVRVGAYTAYMYKSFGRQ